MKARRILPPVAVLLLLLTAASAQGSDADRAAARILAQQAKEALDARDYAAAADRFARADALVHAPTLMLGLARADVGLGKWVAALEVYNRILREGAASDAPQPFFEALKDARVELDALEPRVPSVIIEVVGAATKVTLDGEVVPAAVLGMNRPLDPGHHVIRAEGAGMVPAEATVTATERKVETVTLKLAPARVAVEPPASPASDGSTQRALAFAALGVGGAGLVLGTITGSLAITKHGAIAAACPDPHRCTAPDIVSYHTLGALSNAGFIGGALIAAAGVVLFATAPKPNRGGEATIVPMLGAGWVGAGGRF